MLRSSRAILRPQVRPLRLRAAPLSAASRPDQPPLRVAVAPRLAPSDVQIGCIWLSGLIDRGVDSLDVDPGQEQANAMVAAALAAGIVEFDTAPLYGYGLSEARLGAALAAAGPAARNARLYTKVGRLIRGPGGSDIVNDYTAAGADTSLDESLERLEAVGWPSIDFEFHPIVHTLRVHDANDSDTQRRDGVDEVAVCNSADGCVPRLVALRENGTLRGVSIGANSNSYNTEFHGTAGHHQGVPDEIIRLIQTAPEGSFDSALLAGGWNLLNQAGMPVMMECQRASVAVHVAGVFNTGLLVGGDTYAYAVAPDAMIERARGWGELAAARSASLPAVALAFAAMPECVEKLVIGMATAEEVEQNIAWLAEAQTVSPALWVEAKALGLLPADIPTPV
jgi:D-threo-aldose 1-dehydrogenase